MAQSSLRKSLALSAVLATSVGTALAASSAANATTYGDQGSPVTVTVHNQIQVVGGGTITLPAGAHDVSWAGQGGRFAFIGADNGIYTADYNGGNIVKLAQGVNPSHTVWDVSSMIVFWTEGTGASAKIVGVLSGGGGDAAFDAIDNPPAGLGLSSPDVAADYGTSMVFQTTDASGNTGISEVSYNGSGQQVVTQIVAPGDAVTGGSAPTISPDGNTVVFVRNDAGGDGQLFLTSKNPDGTWTTPKAITSAAGNRSNPIFETDGRTVAYRWFSPTPAGLGAYQVDVTAASPAEIQVSNQPVDGVAVRTDHPAQVHRLGGADRFATAVEVSQQQFRKAGDTADHRAQAQAVVLSRSDQFADALGGAALAAHQNGPLLLTQTASLNAWTRAEIQRVLPVGGTVFVLGGTQAISPTVASQLAGLGYHVQRIGGTDRYDTAVRMASVYAPNAKQVLAATGLNFPDALSAGAAAAALPDTAVVLTADTQLPAVTKSYIHNKITSGSLRYLAAVGGQADKALGSAYSGFANLGGADRYQTSFNVAAQVFGTFSAVGLATGRNWPDSLSGGALMGRAGGPLVLVDPTYGITPVEYRLFDANRGADNYGYVFGGTAALPARVDAQLASAIDTATGSAHDNGVGTTRVLSTPSLTVK